MFSLDKLKQRYGNIPLSFYAIDGTELIFTAAHNTLKLHVVILLPTKRRILIPGNELCIDFFDETIYRVLLDMITIYEKGVTGGLAEDSIECIECTCYENKNSCLVH